MQWCNSRLRQTAPTQQPLVSHKPTSRSSILGIVSRNSVLALCAGFALVTAVALASAQDKVLENLKGVVRYESAGVAARDLALNGTVGVSDRNILSTGSESLGKLTLPDSSTITLGGDTRVELSRFDLSNVAHAAFVLYSGKTRFAVNHPKGALANYTFKTPVGEIAVRGTQGDISVDIQDGMRLNVYHLGENNQPVTLDTIYGEHFTLHGGEKVWVRWQNGKLVGRQTVLSRAEVDRFGEFGPPSTIDGGPPK
jgi:hypothetical protein